MFGFVVGWGLLIVEVVGCDVFDDLFLEDDEDYDEWECCEYGLCYDLCVLYVVCVDYCLEIDW